MISQNKFKQIMLEVSSGIGADIDERKILVYWAVLKEYSEEQKSLILPHASDGNHGFHPCNRALPGYGRYFHKIRKPGYCGCYPHTAWDAVVPAF